MTEALVTSIQRFAGLSSDSKSTTAGTPVGSTWHELDTGRDYIYDGAAWNASDPIRDRFISVSASATMTRPADTNVYAAYDAVANNTAAGSVTPLAFVMSVANDQPITIERLRVSATLANVESVYRGKRIQVHFYNELPVVASGDNAAASIPAANYVGSLTGTFKQNGDASALFTSGATRALCTPDDGARIITNPNNGGKTLYALVEILDATASNLASIVFSFVIEGFQGHA